MVVFIDEMDSLLRTRGSGVSSDVETTIVPQFLSELDGVESLDNVMVIGASNRVDMIDPAVLRPGRLDVKIRVGRPKTNQAIAIVDHYLTDDLPLEDGVDAHALSAVLVHDIYGTSERRHLCDVQEENGQWHALFLADVVSGAMLKNIVDRAKTRAVKESIETARTWHSPCRCSPPPWKTNTARPAIPWLTWTPNNGRASTAWTRSAASAPPNSSSSRSTT